MNTRANRKIQSETHTATGRHADVLGDAAQAKIRFV